MAWERIERALEAQGRLLPAGAKRERLLRAGEGIGVEWPAPFFDLWTRHDGSGGPLAGGREILAVDAIVVAWWAWKKRLDRGDFEGARGQPVGPVRADWWNARWIPFTVDDRGDHDALDLDPAAGGLTGQVIRLRGWDPTRAVVADDLLGFLGELGEMVERVR